MLDTSTWCKTVKFADMTTDRDSSKSKSFGFIEMNSNSEVRKTIQEINGDFRSMKPTSPRREVVAVTPVVVDGPPGQRE